MPMRSTPSTTTVGGKTYYLIGAQGRVVMVLGECEQWHLRLIKCDADSRHQHGRVTTFAPIGNYTHKFQGTFDGQFQRLTNLVVTQDSACSLFGRVYNSTLKRIILGSGCSFTITNRVNDESNKLYGESVPSWAMQARMNSLYYHTISQCGSEEKGDFREWNRLVVASWGKWGSQPTNCWFAGTINASRTTGGIVGSTEAGDYGFVLNSSYEGGKSPFGSRKR